MQQIRLPCLTTVLEPPTSPAVRFCTTAATLPMLPTLFLSTLLCFLLHPSAGQNNLPVVSFMRRSIQTTTSLLASTTLLLRYFSHGSLFLNTDSRRKVSTLIDNTLSLSPRHEKFTCLFLGTIIQVSNLLFLNWSSLPFDVDARSTPSIFPLNCTEATRVHQLV